MKRFTTPLISALAALTAVTAIAPTASANPFVTSHGDWTVIQDSANDGTGGNGIFEVFGMAYKQDGNILSFAINSAMGIEGNYWKRAKDKNIGYGDLKLNFGDTEYGVRFAGSNDSGVSEVGLYSDITTMDVTKDNSGWINNQKYRNHVQNKKKGEVRLYGDERDAAIFASGANRQSGHVLKSGTKVSDVTLLSADEVLDFDAAFGGDETGAETFGFSFEMPKEMMGKFVAELWLECINDSVAIDGVVASKITSDPVGVPEPATGLGLMGVAALGGLKIRRRHNPNNDEE